VFDPGCLDAHDAPFLKSSCFIGCRNLISSYDETMNKARAGSEPTRGPRDDRGVVAAQIVAAARNEFVDHGVSGTTFRAIARRAEVDPALVHYYFASKEALLDAATTPPPELLESVKTAISAPLVSRGRSIIQNVLGLWSNPDISDILRATFLCANVDETTREKLRASMSSSFIGATAERLPQGDRMVRAGLVSSQIIGLCWLRYIWELDPLASMSEEAIVAHIAPTLQKYLNGRL
jgi:AcrR family transcriptional regulator